MCCTPVVGKHPPNTVSVAPQVFLLWESEEDLSVRSLFCLYPHQYNIGVQNFFQENALLILYGRKWEQVLPLGFLHVWKIFPEMGKTNQTLRTTHWFQGQKWCEILPFKILITFQKDTFFQFLYKAKHLRKNSSTMPLPHILKGTCFQEILKRFANT